MHLLRKYFHMHLTCQYFNSEWCIFKILVENKISYYGNRLLVDLPSLYVKELRENSRYFYLNFLQIFFLNFWRTQILLLEPLIPPFRRLVKSSLGFKPRVDSLIPALQRRTCYTFPDITFPKHSQLDFREPSALRTWSQTDITSSSYHTRWAIKELFPAPYSHPQGQIIRKLPNKETVQVYSVNTNLLDPWNLIYVSEHRWNCIWANWNFFSVEEKEILSGHLMGKLRYTILVFLCWTIVCGTDRFG